MLADNIKACPHMLALCAAVSHLHPVGSLEGRDVRVMSTDASDTIPISLISDKFIELIALQKHPTHEEHVDHQKLLDTIKRLNEGAFTELQEKYVEQNLEAYLSDSSATGIKREVVKRIRNAFYTKSNLLFLNDLGLNQLPEALWQLTQLHTLSLAENALTTLSDAAGRLVQLQTLNLSRNQLTSLPDALGQLVQLERLVLTGNQLTSLPDALGQLARLTYLSLTSNQLKEVPATLERCTQLDYLGLDGNKLTSLPAALGLLTRLHRLDLARNELKELPAALGQLIQLEYLDLAGNSNLRELPLTLGSIPELMFIGIGSTALNPRLVDALLAQCAAIRQAQERDILSPRLQTWKTAGNSQVDLSDIKRFTDDDKEILNKWLVRLEKTNDFEGNRQPLAQTVCEMLHSMTKNEELKSIFLTFMDANNETHACEDRTAQALNELYTAWQLWQLPKDAPLSERLNVMIRAANTHALRAAIDQRIKKWERTERRLHLEAVEIQLYFELEVGKKLPLLNAIQEMRFPAVGNRTWIQVDDLVETVRNTAIDHLIELPFFAKVLADDKKFQEMWAPQESVLRKRMEALEDLAWTEDVSKSISDERYRSDSEKIMVEHKQKYKETVEAWLILNGVKNVSG